MRYDSLKSLRAYVRYLIHEGIDDRNLFGLGVIWGPFGGSREAIIFDIEGMKRVLEPWVSGEVGRLKPEMFGGVVRGMMMISPPKHPCAGAWEVSVAWGPGLGDVVYGLGHAMSPSGILISDRSNVSKSAQDGWRKQAEKGGAGERSSVPLDDVEAHSSGSAHPNHTDDPGDDCLTYGIDYLDRAYMPRGNEGALLNRLVRQGDEAFVGLERVDRNNVLKALRGAVEEAFGRDIE